MIKRPPLRVPLAVTGVLLAVLTGAPVFFTGAPVASAGVTKGVKPDIVLSPQKRTHKQQVQSILVNDFSPLAHDEAEEVNPPSPDQCRDVPALDLVCDVYRIRIVKDPTPGASNFVQILISWPRQASTPALALGVVGLSSADLPDIDVFLYADADAPLDYTQVGGRSAITPERVVFEATQEEYDLVVRSGTGVATEYSLSFRVTNELPITPFELLDEVTPPARGDAVAAPAFIDGQRVDPVTGLAVSPMALAPLDTDEQIAGIGLGTTEQFDPEFLGRATSQRAATSGRAPSTVTLLLAMVVTPAACAAASLGALRRRRSAFVL